MKSFFLVIVLLSGSLLFAQLEHVVKAKETVYGITKQYNITQEQLLRANPSIAENGLRIGDLIKIPNQNSKVPAKTRIIKETNDFYFLHIAPKETLYNISKQYNTDLDILRKYNPKLQEGGPKIGDTIRIPKQPESPVIKKDTIIKSTSHRKGIEHIVTKNENALSLISEYNLSYSELLDNLPSLQQKGLNKGDLLILPSWAKPELLSKYNDQKINLLMILPFYMNNPKKSGVQKVAVDFLTGSKMALDSLSESGINIHLKVIDSENDYKSIHQFTQDNSLEEIDAVIGPFYGNLVGDLAEQSKDDYLPIFSPKNNDKDLEKYRNVFLAEPREEVLTDEIVEILLERYAGEQIIVLTDNENESLAKYTKKRLEQTSENANVIITKNIDDLIQPSELISETLENGDKFEQEYFTPIVTILVSNNDKLGKAYVEKLKAMNPDNLSAYGVGYTSAFDEKNQTNMKALLNIGFAYSAIRKSNAFGKDEKRLIQKFKDLYCTGPNKNQQIGFDITYDVVSRMNESGYLQDNINGKQIGFSGGYQYEESNNGKAKINRSVRLIQLFKKPKKDTTVVAN